jgi:hypothetical protein
MKKILLSLLLISTNSYAYTYEMGDFKVDLSGYVGWKQIESFKSFSHIKSEPEVGLITNVQLTDDITVFNQFQYGENVDSILVYNFIKYSPNLFNDIDISFYGGKLRIDYGLYNAHRVNPRTRPGVIEPNSIYWPVLKQALTSGTGVGVEVQYKEFNFKYSITDPTVSNPEAEAQIWTGGLLETLDTTFGSQQFLAVEYTPDDMPLLLKWSWIRLNFGNKTSPLAEFLFPQEANKDNINQFTTFGFMYTYDKFVLSSELLLFKSSFSNWYDLNELSYGHSTRLEYNINDYVSVYTNYNEYNSPLDEKVIDTLNLNKNLGFYKDLSIGTNIHNVNWTFGIEAHYIQGARTVPANNITNPNDFEHWWMVGANLVYHFN